MFRIEVSTAEIRNILNAPGTLYQAARWLKHFHQADYVHIGWHDHPGETREAEVIGKYGFLQTTRFELNSIRLLLRTYGPIIVRGPLAHLTQDATMTTIGNLQVARVSVYTREKHAVILNGYLDGLEARLLYRDPAHPDLQFIVELARLRTLWQELFYLSCPIFPKPCPHVAAAAR